MRYLTVFISLFAISLSLLKAQDKTPQGLFINLNTGLLLSVADFPIDNSRAGFGEIGMGFGTEVEYRLGQWGLATQFNLYLYNHDFERVSTIKEKIYDESPTVFNSVIFSLSPRYYISIDKEEANWGGIYIAPHIGIEHASSASEIRAYQKSAFDNSVPSTTTSYERYKEKHSASKFLNYGIRIGTQGYGGKLLWSLYIGWNNVHLHETIGNFPSDKYGFEPIKMKGTSSQLEAGISMKIPLLTTKMDKK